MWARGVIGLDSIVRRRIAACDVRLDQRGGATVLLDERDVSRPAAERNAGWTGASGRINLLVEEYLHRWRLPKEDTLVYLCGNPGMIQDATVRLTPQGWSVVSEQFWPIRPGEPA